MLGVIFFVRNLQCFISAAFFVLNISTFGLYQLQKFTASLLELWNLMDIPMEEQKTFHNVTSQIAASVSEVTETNMLSIDFLNIVSRII